MPGPNFDKFFEETQCHGTFPELAFCSGFSLEATTKWNKPKQSDLSDFRLRLGCVSLTPIRICDVRTMGLFLLVE